MSFFMPLLGNVHLRKKCAEHTADFTGTDGIYIGNTGAFNLDVKLFLLKQTYKTLLFLSESHSNPYDIDIFCLAGSTQQARQSTHLAEGLNPL